jgi:hypothetical protein
VKSSSGSRPASEAAIGCFNFPVRVASDAASTNNLKPPLPRRSEPRRRSSQPKIGLDNGGHNDGNGSCALASFQHHKSRNCNADDSGHLFWRRSIRVIAFGGLRRGSQRRIFLIDLNRRSWPTDPSRSCLSLRLGLGTRRCHLYFWGQHVDRSIRFADVEFRQSAPCKCAVAGCEIRTSLGMSYGRDNGHPPCFLPFDP